MLIPVPIENSEEPKIPHQGEFIASGVRRRSSSKVACKISVRSALAIPTAGVCGG